MIFNGPVRINLVQWRDEFGQPHSAPTAALLSYLDVASVGEALNVVRAELDRMIWGPGSITRFFRLGDGAYVEYESQCPTCPS